MSLRRLTIGAAALLALLPASADAAPPQTSAQIVVYKDAVTNAPRQTRERERDLGFTASQRYRHVIEGFAARLTPQQVADLRSDPDVADVVPDRPVHAAAEPIVPGGSLPVGLRRIGAVTGGTVRSASGVAVAVLDTGIDLDNADLNATAGKNCMSASDPPRDDNGHGTHVAGTIGARNNGFDAVGVAPGTQLYAVKVLGSSGQGTESSIICGLDWVAQNASALGIRVVNMSLGGTGPRGSCSGDPERGAVCAVTNAGVTIVVAAGNDSGVISDNNTTHVPAAYPEALTVTGMADTDGLPGSFGADCDDVADDSAADFSNWAGPPDRAHTIAAPGECVVSSAVGGGVKTMSGTSMATPHVAGSVALCIDEATIPGPCAGLTPAAIITTLRDAAANAATPANGFLGDPLHPLSSSRYYGFLVRASLAPAAATGAADVLGETEASLAGTVDTHDADGSWWFEVGPEAGVYDQATAVQTGNPGAGRQPVQGSATGLDPGTTHHYRLAARVDGWTAYGDDKTFTTPGTPPPAAPDTSLDSEPDARSTTGFAQFTFSASPPANASGFECRLDTPTWTACSSPFTVDDVGDGSHTFTVRAVGLQGKRDATPAGFSWNVDRTPPETKISGAPTDPTSNTEATFGIVANEAGSTFECRLDGAAWSTCASVVRFRVLEPGRHRFEARATDTVGLTDASPAAYDWTISGTTVTTEQPGPTPPGDGGENPLAPNPVGPLATPIARLTSTGAAHIDRKRHRVRLTVVCHGPGRCAGILELVLGGKRLAAAPIGLAGGKRAVVSLLLTRAAANRLGRGVPARATLRLAGGRRTSFGRRTIKLLT